MRYIEHHQFLNIKGPMYVMSVREKFSRMLLASILSEKQDTAACLWILAIALRNYGVTSTIVTDGGGIFYPLRAWTQSLSSTRWSGRRIVKNPRVIETGYRSQQLPCGRLARIEWLLAPSGA